MKNRTAILIGSVLIILGFFSIIDNVFGINLWTFIFPIILIGLGVLILFRPKTLPGGSNFILRFINETDISHTRTIESAEYLSFVSDVKLDLSQAIIPVGETTINLYSFASDLDIILPIDAGLKVRARGFVHDAQVIGRKEDHLLAAFEYETPDYKNQIRKIFIQTLSFVSEVDIKE